MLSVSGPIKDAQRATNYYTDMAKDDYYANRHEKAGRWWGHGAEQLGLSGNVNAEDFRNLLNGLSPDGSEKLVQNAQSKGRQCGWDLTFSPPKSVSVFWAMAPPEVQRRIEAAHFAAVEESLEYLQDQAAITRRGQGGKQKEHASLVIAVFEHAASRALDPDLHSHAVVLNISLRKDGTWGSLHSNELFEHRFKSELIYHVGLALRLRMDIGLEVQMQEPAFRLTAVPEELCQTLSKRRKAIQQFMQEHGLEGTAAAKLAALQTRPRKQQVARDELFAYWRRVGEAHGWGEKQAARALELAQPIHLDQAERNSRFENIRSEFNSWDKGAGSPDGANGTAQGQAQSSGTTETEQPGWSNGASSAPNENKPKTNKDRVFRNTSRNNYRFKHRKWGEILWQKKVGAFEIRAQKKRMFPKAPGWSPLSKVELRALRVIPRKTKLHDKAPWKKPEPKVHWRKKLGLAELQWVDKELFPDAPWHVARRLKLRRLRFARKQPKSPPHSQSSKIGNMRRNESGQSQSHAH